MDEHAVPASAGPNAEQAEYWSGRRGEHWAAHQDRYDAMVAPLSAGALVASRGAFRLGRLAGDGAR